MLQIYNKIFNHQIDFPKKCKTLCTHINAYIYNFLEILYIIVYNFLEILYFFVYNFIEILYF